MNILNKKELDAAVARVGAIEAELKALHAKATKANRELLYAERATHLELTKELNTLTEKVTNTNKMLEVLTSHFELTPAKAEVTK